ncbi:Deoxyribonuclease-2-alpha [Lamellibrachia satsuma]|nr:Deoxyribonuclease-2-alpha [Lamellibrachia satsuma]
MPWVYDHNMPDYFAKTSPQMALVLQNKHVKQEPWNNTVVLQSKEGQKFISFAKYRKFDADLYDALVAPSLGSPLYVETWQNGVKPSPSNCTAQYKVFNIKSLQVGSVPFREPEDHAKWCVTTDRKVSVVCIGDINRQESQKLRAGGTVCFKHDRAWKAFSSSVTQVEKCQTLTRSDLRPQPLNLL